MSPTLPIYHEHQSSRLCAQHALNTLLQGDYFSAIDLAEIAKTLDEGEKEIDDKITQSQNMDDSGFFSSQVIMKALEVFNLSVIPIGKPGVEDAKRKPEDEVAFIANHQEHWLTLRRFGEKRWYNLNSLNPAPEFIGDVYLSALLDQLISDQYTVFVIRGLNEEKVPLPMSDADHLIKYLPKQPESNQEPPAQELQNGRSMNENANNDFQTGNAEDEDAQLQEALMLSMGSTVPTSAPAAPVATAPMTKEQMREARLAKLG